MSVRNLAPALLWSHFYEMNQIPRASKKEEKLRAFCLAYANRMGFAVKEDAVGNIVITKEATSGYEKAPKVILQGHIDMVCQKNPSSTHDFDHDPISMIVEGAWVKAEGTTLGADNGIGVAAALAILEDPAAQHGPLEVFLTVDEEAGMGGVRAMQSDWLQGDYLINLDSETFGTCCVGCAGGADITLSKRINYQPVMAEAYMEICLEGLKGGHSGIDIHTGRGNANQLLAEVVSALIDKIDCRLVYFKGGTLRNVLTREAVCAIAYEKKDQAVIEAHLQDWNVWLKERLQMVDEDIKLSWKNIAAMEAITATETQELLALLTLLPHGVLRQSAVLPVVETSCNIGIVNISKDQGVNISLLARSLLDEGIAVVGLRAKNLAILSGCTYNMSNQYPAWTPNLKAAPLLKLKQIFQEVFHEELKVEVIHAGLETGLIGKLYPHLEMVSFGPTIKNAHSPDEMVNIQSVTDFYSLLKNFLASMNN